MNELLNQFDFTTQQDFSVLNFSINIVIAAILLFILSKLYVKYGNAISNREQLSRVFILVGITTFIIISIVKSSLALSLGLVGALSIVRFRTAIKEPEELGFFFISIAIGLGLGANQFLPTFIGFVLLIIIIILMKKNVLNSTLTQNIVINLPVNGADKDDMLEKISGILSEHSRQLELKRFNKTAGNLNLNYLISISDMDRLQVISKELGNIDEDMTVTFIDSVI
ncbi:DUF4956 domain-containing protein [Muriicola sp. Z0-33]|uniref:DUF4956 domain-containing protein n=1 Tax=Muriicola sp. Z0-33 TaxID=2816957 RepID=UPI0022381EE3|nr:DUF4956 domain-containing protein [Muriicola sp. Z0-33]MCW5515376.1 DUF4956 domain-containing protein [Muriicola sp. Z0-33]